MKDPIGAFDAIKENFIRYLKTAFKTKFDSLEKEREELVNKDRVLYREPWVELLPEYLSSNKNIFDLDNDDLPGMEGVDIKIFKGLVSQGLVPEKIKLYSHQVEMLKAGLQGKNCIITSGTGSGKTESFLLPLFAQLSKEISGWKAPGQRSSLCNDWWKKNLPVNQIVDAENNYIFQKGIQQRFHENRQPGLRALILYPMNALVEDQMTRLRIALDSDSIRTWAEESLNGNNIYFGRYNSSTPVAGKLERIMEDGSSAINKFKLNELRRKLKSIERNSEKVIEYISQEKRHGREVNEKELISFFQRLDGNEMRCRFDMQIKPPDIMITNFSMLSIMLMREIDNSIFEETRKWLSCEDLPEIERQDNKKKRIFHLIVDELHLYRGTQGTEVAYLLKLVLKRLGLTPDHPQLRILASSASIESEDEASIKYVSDFFGFKDKDDVLDKFIIIPGYCEAEKKIEGEQVHLPTEPFVNIIDSYETCQKDIKSDEFKQTCVKAGTDLIECFNLKDKTSKTVEDFLKIVITPELEFRERLRNACLIKTPDGNINKPVCSFRKDGDNYPDNYPYFFQSIFGSKVKEGELRKASQGLLLMRSLYDNFEIPIDNYSLPRFRFHYFFRNIEGLWASTEIGEYPDGRTIGEIYSTPTIKTELGYRVLELLYCDNCGTTFLGGSRGVGEEDSICELLPVSPNIEGVPEKTPAKLVEKRSYQEYGIFWPQGDQEFIPHDRPSGYWRQTVINSSTNATHYRAQWVQAYLNKFSGDLFFEREEEEDKYLKGFYFQVKDENQNVDMADLSPDIPFNKVQGGLINSHKALPCVCPGCGVNEQYRIKTSSIRGFRTGFAKTSQLFAKELVYQLDDPNQNSQTREEKRKLIVFSDSREDAAQISNGIERNHFTDLLRENLIQILHENILLKDLILSEVEKGEINSYLRENNIEIYDEIEALYEDSRLAGVIKNTKKLSRRDNAKRKLKRIKKRLIKVEDLVETISSSNDCAPIVKEFLKLGVNPASPKIKYQKIPYTNRSWSELFDFKEYKWEAGNPDFQHNLKTGIYIELASLFFGNLFYSLEASGLGYLSVNPDNANIIKNANNIGLKSEDYIDILNATIRILGHKYKYNPTDFDQPNYPNVNDYKTFPALMREYLKKVADKNNLLEREFGEVVIETLCSQNILGNSGLNIKNLFIKAAADSDPVWVSERGKRAHLHRSGGVCTQYPSTTELPEKPNDVCMNLWSKNYLSFSAAIEKRIPIRLHCEELTGQTDDQFERQRHFRNIILMDEGQKETKVIDLLSVTTTLEVGVDIGSLQAVMLANMPPQRFNYQQRVGRSGRRGQAFSLILTFCRGRSHDEFYFNNIHKITGDPPPTPFLTMGQLRIFTRLLVKEVLRQAFSYLFQEVGPSRLETDELHTGKSVHGEFGKIEYWSKYRSIIENWITSNYTEVSNIIDTLGIKIGTSKKEQILKWVCSEISDKNSLLNKVESIILNDEIASRDISEKLAEGGILPMFGMPTSIRNMYHEIIYNENEGEFDVKSIDRSTDLAIHEFAPGAQKTKDKTIHTCIGFTGGFIPKNSGYRKGVTADSNVFYNERWMKKCKSCGFVQTEKEEPRDRLCVCGESFTPYVNVFPIKSPKAYRTDLSQGRDFKENSEINISRPPILVEGNDESEIERDIRKNYEIKLSDKDISWRINTNNDSFYEGKLYRTGNLFPFDSTMWFNFENQWIISSATDYIDSGYQFHIHNLQNNMEQIALAAHKHTEILKINPIVIPDCIDLNMYGKNRPLGRVGIRSGFYSAAFFLQRVLADKLDIDPTEIEIADIQGIRTGNGKIAAEIILTDELPNGSGFVRQLYNDFDSILEECLQERRGSTFLDGIFSDHHLNKCKDACYGCLKVFRNMNYHTLLDWRLGVSLLRIYSDSNFLVGADGNFDEYIELKNWLNEIDRLKESFIGCFNFKSADHFGYPGVLTTDTRNYYLIITHPFWDCFIDKNGTINYPKNLWISKIINKVKDQAKNDGAQVRFLDVFNLQRRPGWCYQKIIE
ncbi:MAG: DEAD/DEAH box helicase [Desulfobacterales bacterium]|nr:DEAD/DEAH box helicase [Desulfobacterales bacterium]